MLAIASTFSISTASAQVSTPAPDIEIQKLEARERFDDALKRKSRAQVNIEGIRRREATYPALFFGIVGTIAAGVAIGLAQGNNN